MAFKVIIIVIELMFLGINMFLALLRAHFNPRYARAKMILSQAKNICGAYEVGHEYLLGRGCYSFAKWRTLCNLTKQTHK